MPEKILTVILLCFVGAGWVVCRVVNSIATVVRLIYEKITEEVR